MYAAVPTAVDARSNVAHIRSVKDSSTAVKGIVVALSYRSISGTAARNYSVALSTAVAQQSTAVGLICTQHYSSISHRAVQSSKVVDPVYSVGKLNTE